MSRPYVSYEDWENLERFTGADYLASKNLLAWSSDKEGVFLKNLEEGTAKKITAGGKGEGNPLFSPDGAYLLFLSPADGGRQIFLYELESGKIRQLTHIIGPVMEPLWSPKGDRILFTALTGTMGSGKIREDEPVVIEDFGYKFDGVGYYRPDNHRQLCLVNLEDEKVIPVTDPALDYLHPVWTLDGQGIICVGNQFRTKAEALGMDLLMVEACAQGQVKRLSQGLSAVSYPNPVRPSVASDGSVIAGFMQETGDKEDTYPEVYLYRVTLDGKEMQRIFEPDEECYQCVQFPYNAFSGWGFDKMQIDRAENAVLFLSGWNGQCRIYRLELSQAGPQRAKCLIGEEKVVNGIGRIQDGKALAAFSQPDRPEYYALIDTKTGEIIQEVASSAAELTERTELCRPFEFCVDTLDGDSRIHGWVMPPAGYEEGKNYPAILYIHGGPHPFYTYGFTMEFQCLAAAGFAVLYCNPRGTSGYGWNHQLYEKAIDGRAYMDLLQFVDEACRRYPFIDSHRIGVTGGSYGGYMVNYMAAHCSRFQAYVTQRSVSNDMIQYASSDMQGSSKKYENFEEFMVNQLKTSAVSYAERVDKPFLILHGEDDYRTAVENAHQLFVALKDLHPDLPVKMVIYPHTSHEQPEHPAQRRHYYRELLGWFQKYL